MKLEIKHLAPYLPYNLQLIGGFSKVIMTDSENFGDKESIGMCLVMNRKPTLRPLSDLVKEIEVNGEKFVPVVELLSLSFGYLKLNKSQLEIDNSNGVFTVSVSGILCFSFDSSDNSFVATNKGKTVCVHNQLELFSKLYEWYFDIHGLIDQGLAIDINTLK